jgi:hypothetical protein
MAADFSQSNAEALERVLADRRRQLAGLGTGEERARRAQALELIEQYTLLLREPPPPGPLRTPVRYCFKLVFPDGRWSVDEIQLTAEPRRGDVVEIDGRGNWRIESSQRIGAKPAGKPPREMFVCAPAA